MKENIWAFGTFAAVISIITGVLLFFMVDINKAYFLYMGLAQRDLMLLKILGIIWASFSLPAFYAITLFEKHKKHASALVFLISGIAALFFGVGFFTGAALLLFTGYLAMRDYWHDIHFKRLGVLPWHELHEKLARGEKLPRPPEIKARARKVRRKRK